MAAICIRIKTNCHIIRRTKSSGNEVVFECIEIDFERNWLLINFILICN